MKTIVFDTGPLISLTMNNLLWIIEPLKSNNRFYITDLVKKELVDTPLQKTKKYKFEALQVLHYIENGTLEIIGNQDIDAQTKKLLSIANNCFKAFGHSMNLVHDAEMSALALYLQKKADAFAVDEKTTRLLIENPNKLKNILRHNLHAKIEVDKSALRDFKKIAGGVRMIRSIELSTIAYEKGLLDRYLTNIGNAKRTLLESVLWGMKLNGCSVTRREIEQILRMET